MNTRTTHTTRSRRPAFAARRTPVLRAAALLPIAALAAATSGCSVIESIANQPRNAHFDTVDGLEADPDVTAAWVPSDSTNLRLIAARDGSTSALLIDSASTLDSALCVKTDRESAPDLVLEEAPEAYDVTSVFACGDWSVIASADGWWGWTPNSKGEAAASDRNK